MENSQRFTQMQQAVIQLLFAIKLNIPADPILEDEIKDLKRLLLISHKHEFGRSDYIYDPKNVGGTIIGNNNYRNIVITPSLLQYTERKSFNTANFNDICTQLYDFYITKRHVSVLDVKVIGKVSQFDFHVGQNSIELLKSKTNLFKDKTLSSLNIKATILQDDKNVHLNIHNQENVDDHDGDEDIVTVTLDINNHDQISGINEESFSHIINFSDNFVKEQLFPLLNQYLG